jgi:hypothetical protein
MIGGLPCQNQSGKNPAFSSAISALVAWALKEFSRATMSHVISFLITFSAGLIGLLVFLTH